jgi:hypothetical protein
MRLPPSANCHPSHWAWGTLGARTDSAHGSTADSFGKQMTWQMAVCDAAPQVAGSTDWRSYQGESRVLDSLGSVCPGQVGSEYPATSVPFSKATVRPIQAEAVATFPTSSGRFGGGCTRRRTPS